MSTPTGKKPNASERLAKLEKSVAKVQKGADEPTKTLEHGRSRANGADARATSQTASAINRLEVQVNWLVSALS